MPGTSPNRQALRRLARIHAVSSALAVLRGRNEPKQRAKPNDGLAPPHEAGRSIQGTPVETRRGPTTRYALRIRPLRSPPPSSTHIPGGALRLGRLGCLGRPRFVPAKVTIDR